MVVARRTFLTGLAAAIAFPYIVRDSGILMPAKDRTIYRLGKWPLEVWENGIRTVYELDMILQPPAPDNREWAQTPDGQRLLLSPQDQFRKKDKFQWLPSSATA